MSLFREWFHAQYLKDSGPVIRECEESRGKHRDAKYWAGSAWLEATSRAHSVVASVNNYDNPMTANDCLDEIKKIME